MGDDVTFQLDEQAMLQMMERDLVALEMVGAAISAQMAEASAAAVQAMDQFADALRQFNEGD